MFLTQMQINKNIAIVVILVICSHLVGCASIGQAEYKEFQPMPSHARLMNQVKLSWEVRADVGSYCLKTLKQRGYLNSEEPIACAIWSAASNECRIITSPNPNHVVLGHEVRHCFEGHFHP